MLFDFVKSFLESLKSEGYSDIIDADSCNGIIFAASNMSDEVLVSWYRETVSDFLNVSVESISDYDADEVGEEERIRFFYSALIDILAAMCFVRHIVLVPRLDS